VVPRVELTRITRRRPLWTRSNQFLLAGLVGVLTGAAVALFEWVVLDQGYERLADAPLAVQAAMPVFGLALAAISLRYLGRGASPATSDEYIENFHRLGRRLDLRPVWARIVAGATTLGSGGALGFEGPSLYMGAAIGSGVQRRFAGKARGEDAKLLMVAGAAAGVAAIFKAPATGAIFALEVPYRDDNARRMLLPTLLASAAGYLTAAAFQGTTPLFSIEGTPPFDFRELGGALALGILCGIGARGFAIVIRASKRVAARTHVALRVVVAGAALAGLAVLSVQVYDQQLALGSGYRVLDWVTEPSHSIALIAGLLAVRVVATATTVGGGGVGGLFIPLVIAGALTGDLLATAVGDQTSLFPVIGVAAFLGAGYRTPLAGVMFIAETTGRPGFVVPGLIASVASQLVMGDESVSPYQEATRRGHLERRLQLPISASIDADVITAPPDIDVATFYRENLLLTRQREVPVVDGSRYVGVISIAEVQAIAPEEWSDHLVGEVADREWPIASTDWTLEQAVRAMEDHGTDIVIVLDGHDRFVGIVSMAAVVRLDEIIEASAPESE
jgi:CIC family chloride channel protein